MNAVSPALGCWPARPNAWARGAVLYRPGWIYGMHDRPLRNLGPYVCSVAERDALPSIGSCVHDAAEPGNALRRHATDAFTALEPCCGNTLPPRMRTA